MIKVITGAMYSGKSYRVIELLEGLDINRILLFKPKIDTRDNEFLKSRKSDITYKGILIDKIEEIKDYINEDTKTIVIDEAQFLIGDIQTIIDLHLSGIDFIISGLNLTSDMEPFGIMKEIMCIATDIEILKAKCSKCGKETAEYTQTKVCKATDILVDNEKGEGIYFPICRECLNKEEKCKDRILIWDDDSYHEPYVWINNKFAGVDIDIVVKSALYQDALSKEMECEILAIYPWSFSDYLDDKELDKMIAWFQSMPKFTEEQWNLIFKGQWQRILKTFYKNP